MEVVKKVGSKVRPFVALTGLLALGGMFAAPTASAQSRPPDQCVNVFTASQVWVSPGVVTSHTCATVEVQGAMSSTVDRCTPPPNVTCTGIPIFYIRARRVDIPGRQTVLATGFTINPQTCGVTATSTQFTPWVECWRGFSPPQFVELVSVYF